MKSLDYFLSMFGDDLEEDAEQERTTHQKERLKSLVERFGPTRVVVEIARVLLEQEDLESFLDILEPTMTRQDRTEEPDYERMALERRLRAEGRYLDKYDPWKMSLTEMSELLRRADNGTLKKPLTRDEERFLSEQFRDEKPEYHDTRSAGKPHAKFVKDPHNKRNTSW